MNIYPQEQNKNRLVKNLPKKYDKGWGYELWIHNDNNYCGKILHFYAGGQGSFHYHIDKIETWYISSGSFNVYIMDTETADPYLIQLKQGDTLHINRGVPHKILCFEEGDIFEISTQHFEHDSYRIGKGNSQLKK